MALPNFLTLLNHLTKLALDSLYAITYLGNILIVFLIIPMIDFSDLWKLKSSRCHADWILFLQTKCFFVCQHQKFTILFQKRLRSSLAFIFFGWIGRLSPLPQWITAAAGGKFWGICCMFLVDFWPTGKTFSFFTKIVLKILIKGLLPFDLYH